MKKMLQKALLGMMLLSLLSGALVILCSIIAQTINEQIDPRIRAEQAVREAEVQP